MGLVFRCGAALANLGNPEVRKGITDMVSGFITEFEMTWYRQDFNIPPERYWELADTPDRTSHHCRVPALYGQDVPYATFRQRT